jgi:dTDP-4-dehydrorhamnose reductase
MATRALITGASGFVGRHVLAAVPDGWDVVAPSSTDCDITDARRVDDVFGAVRPEVVIHLAYRKPDERVIVDGSRHVAAAAARHGARLVHLSSDVVFGGRPTPYCEADPLSPANDYGRCKAAAELAVADSCPGAVMIRTSLVYGTSHLAPIQTDVVRVVRGEVSMRFFTDETRCPIHADDLAAAVITLAADRSVVGPLHVAGPEEVSRADLARAFARHLGLDPTRVPTSSLSESGLDRPGRVVLDSSQAHGLGIRPQPLMDALRALPPNGGTGSRRPHSAHLATKLEGTR